MRIEDYINIDFIDKEKIFTKLNKDEDYYLLEKGTNYVLSIDIAKLFRKYHQRTLLDIFKNLKNNTDFIKYLYNKVVHITPTTFFLFTNIKINDWFNDDSIVQNMLDTFPEYNFFFYLDENFDIDKINEKNRYFFNSTAYDCEEYRFFNYLNPHKNFPNFYSIIRYPKLLEIFDDNRKPLIPFLLPVNSPLLEGYEYEKVRLNGFKPATDLTYFIRDLGKNCEACLIKEIDFDFFFEMEVTFNLFSVYEGNRIIRHNGTDYQALFFYSNQEDKNNKYPKTKKHTENGIITEDYMASDIYTVIPIKYDNLKILNQKKVIENNFMVNNILTGLGFQDDFEFGNQNRMVRQFDKRVKFFDLGTVNIITSDEDHYNYYIKNLIELDEQMPIPVRLIALCDEDTHTAVLILANLAVKDKPGNYLDEISRNRLIIDPTEEIKSTYSSIVQEENGIEFINFYKYLKLAYHFTMVGTPRNLIISSNLYNATDPVVKERFFHIKAGFLYGVSIYNDSEELGKIIDPELLEYLEKPYGDSIYDYASSYYSEINALLYDETYKDYIVERVDFAVVDLMYLILIQFEYAAIENASSAISSFINYYQVRGHSGKKKRKMFFAENTLDSIDKIHEEYSLTLDFWNVQSNYHSSNKVLQTMRERFKIDADIERLERTTEAMRNIYTAKQTRSSRFSGLLLSLVGIIFTLQQLSDLFESIIKNDGNVLTSIEEFIFNSLDGLLMIRVFLGLFIIWLGVKIVVNSINNRYKQ